MWCSEQVKGYGTFDESFERSRQEVGITITCSHTRITCNGLFQKTRIHKGSDAAASLGWMDQGLQSKHNVKELSFTAQKGGVDGMR
jgi:hypothetical protein